MIIAFDVDDTLIVPSVATGFDRDTPNYDVIMLYRWFQSQGHTMVIWSGGGKDYAEGWAGRLGLTADYIFDKHWPYIEDGSVQKLMTPDLTFDDSDLTLGKLNVKVKRVNNGVVRYPERVGHRHGKQ
jgi:hypothetical protein